MGGRRLAFQPQRVLVEAAAVDLPLARRVLSLIGDTPVDILAKPGRSPGAPRGSAREIYTAAKQTLYIGLHPDRELRGCRPSADFELALGAGCPGLCQYCYLQGSLGARPYVRVYADLDRILATVTALLENHGPGQVSFECSSTSDPIAVEHLTGALAEVIPFFGRAPRARLRLVTKYSWTEGLLNLEHAGHTKIRFSLNTPHIAGSFEAGTDPVPLRIAAANRLGLAGYPIGFVLAPLMIYDGWEHDYDELLSHLASDLRPELREGLTFELISHRFTARTKEMIRSRFPKSRLDLDESGRQVKRGRYGRQKFVYPADQLRRLWDLVRDGIVRRFPAARIEYQI